MSRKFYAVAKGRIIGIFYSWEECEKQVNGFSGALFKSFRNIEDANVFLLKNNSDLNKKNEDNIFEKQKKDIITIKKRKRESEIIEHILPNKRRKFDKIKIYTDGGCFNNGFDNARAGIGVFFGINDSRNISKEVIGKQTNNTAELSAIIEALRVVKNYEQDVEICTDSEYCIKGITGINKIKKNGELFQEIFKLINERKGKTHFKKVKAHTGLKDGNYYADLLAKNGANTHYI